MRASAIVSIFVSAGLVFASAGLIFADAAHGQTQLTEDPGEKAQRLYGRGEVRECFEFIEPLVLGAEKKNPRLQFLYAEILKRYGRRDEAIKHFEELLKLAPYGAMASIANENLRELRGPAQIQTHSKFGGRKGYVGIRVRREGLIDAVFPGSAAARAGLRNGDKIFSVDGGATALQSANEIGNKIMGLEGTKVNLVIVREGKQYSVSLVRGAAVESEYEALNGRSTYAASHGRNLEPPRGTSSSTSTSTATSAAAPISTPETTSRPASSSVNASADTLIPIEIFRRTADSNAMKQEVEGALAHVSEDVRSRLHDYGLKVVIAPTVIDALPELAGERPAGYLHGGSYSNCPGLYRNAIKTIFVAERVSHGSHVPQLNVHMEHVFFHELGHAFDFCARISQSDEFKSIYDRECARLTNGVRNEFYYFTQEGAAGSRELFAELFSCAVSGPGTLDTRSSNLVRSFPDCFQYVQKLK